MRHSKTEMQEVQAAAGAAIASARQRAQPRYITLREWAELMFSTPPHQNTLLRWVNEGRIQPQPTKIGRRWRIKPSAVYVAD